MNNILEGFQDSRRTAEMASLFAWLDGADRMEAIQEIKRRMLDFHPLRAGDHILDVGCGLGHEVRRLSQVIGPGGRVVGLDKNEAMIVEARRRSFDTPLPIQYVTGDALHLEFKDDSFDLCRAERVLRYVEEPEQALREMARVTRPGGYTAVFDFDSDQTIVDMPDRVLARRVADVLDAAVPSAWIGRQLVRLCVQAGLSDVVAVPHVVLFRSPQLAVYKRLVGSTLSRAVEAGTLDEADLARWWTWLEKADSDGAFFTATLGFVVVARKL